jgi:hypothetical protein
VPGFGDLSVDTAMQLVADAPGDEIPISARLAVLYDLSKAAPPGQGLLSDGPSPDGLQELASSALRLKPDHPLLPPEQLLADLAEAATAGAPFDTTASASSFEHHEIAFIGDDCCTIRRVQVNGIGATWIFAEFETDATFEGVADWVDPRNWHHWGPLFFRRMDLLASPPAPVSITSPPTGDPHWHGIFHEEVRLFTLVNTLLRCSYWRDTHAAAMTYELDVSLDGEIDVDRGFLLVTDTGPVRRVQVLKIVSFTTDAWDTLASLVCPFWTDWIRGAVKGATKSVPTTPTQPPGTGGSCTETMDEWVEYFGDAARVYADIGSGATSRIRSGQYATPELLADGTRVWSQLAKDWARAWSSWTETMTEVAEFGLDAGFTPPGVPRGPARHTAATAAAAAAGAGTAGGTVVPVAGITESDRAVSSELVSIDSGSAIIPAADVAVSIERLADGSLGARVRTSNTSVPPSLYVGRLDTADGRPLAPVHLYVSRATGGP